MKEGTGKCREKELFVQSPCGRSIVTIACQMPHDVTFMWDLKNRTHEQNKKRNKFTDTESKLMVARGEGWMGR